MARLDSDEIETLRLALNSESRLFASADASHNDPWNEGFLNQQSNGEQTVIVPVEGISPENGAWSKIIAERPETRRAFLSLENAVADYNKAASKHSWDLLEQQKLTVLERNDMVQAAKDSRYPSGTQPQSLGKRFQSRLSSFCSTLEGYLPIIDVLAQVYPSWESLAWGSLRFLLTAKIRYDKLKQQVVSQISDMGNSFRKISALSKIYPTAKIVDHVCEMYSEMAGFLGKAIGFYRDSKIRIRTRLLTVPFKENAIKSTFGKYDSPEVERLEKHINIVMDHVLVLQAGTIAHTNLIADETHRRVQVLSVGVEEKFHSISGKLDVMSNDTRSWFMALLQENLREEFRDASKARTITGTAKSNLIPKLFLGEKPQIRSLLFEELGETDHGYDSSALRSRLIPPHLTYESMGLFRIDDIKQWVESESSGFLWMNGFVEGAYEWTVGFTVDLLRVARLYKYPTIHYFCAEHHGSKHSKYLLQPKAIVHSFIFQLIEQHQDIFRSNPGVLNQARFEDARDSFAGPGAYSWRRWT
ncbi:hypothetical protein MMC30_000189 [Trapelia coarctata]|nr:hypothetical protein [Trapelia coarctata]